MLTAANRAKLPGWPDVTFPSSMTETRRRDLIAQIVPPPFVVELAKQVVNVQVPPQQPRSAVERLEINLTNIQRVPEAQLDELVRQLPKIKSAYVGSDRGKHGHWAYYGETFGWVQDQRG